MFGVPCGISLLGLGAGLYGRAGIDYVADEVLVGFRPERALAAPAVVARFGFEIASMDADGATLRIPRGVSVTRAVEALQASGLVEFAEPNFIAKASYVPGDPAYSSQYGIRLIDCDQGWDLEFGTRNVVVAVIDTGIDAKHPEFLGKLVKGYDFVNKDNNPDDDNGHGSMCAGIIGAQADNAQGIAGVAFGCRIMPIKVLDKSANGSYSNIAKGIRYAADHGAKVINLSLAGTSSSSTLSKVIDYAAGKGAVLVAAAGNDGKKDKKRYPAAYANVISVGAVDRFSQRINISNYGTWVDVAAPGEGIYSTYPGNSYRTMRGTSMATAYVSGEAALLKSRLGVNVNSSFIRNRIKSTSSKVIDWTSYGIVNVERGLTGP